MLSPPSHCGTGFTFQLGRLENPTLRIDLPTRAELDSLLGFRGSPAVSIYLQTTPVTQDTKADRIELENLVEVAVGQMEVAGMPKRSISSIEHRGEGSAEPPPVCRRLQLLRRCDDDFWAQQGKSLAPFCTPETTRTFRLPNKLTNAVEVETVRRRNGGIRLLKKPDDINIGEVVHRMKPNFDLVPCFNSSGSCVIEPACLVAPKRKLTALLAMPGAIGLETITHSRVKT